MELHAEDWDPDGVIIAVRGDVDTYGAGQLQREWQLRTRAGRTRVVLDLSGVRFGCSTFLTVLLQCKRATAGAGGQLVLLEPSDFCVRLLRTACLSASFVQASQREEALAKARSRA